MKFINVTALDGNGSGLEFPSSVNIERIISVVEFPDCVERPKKCEACIVVECREEPMYTKETREDILNLIAAA